MIVDPIVEQVRKTREALIAKHGGLEGWFQHLRRLEKELAAKKKKPRTAKKSRRHSVSQKKKSS